MSNKVKTSNVFSELDLLPLPITKKTFASWKHPSSTYLRVTALVLYVTLYLEGGPTDNVTSIGSIHDSYIKWLQSSGFANDVAYENNKSFSQRLVAILRESGLSFVQKKDGVNRNLYGIRFKNLAQDS